MEIPHWLLEVSREPRQEIHLVSPADGGNGGHSQGLPCSEESQDSWLQSGQWNHSGDRGVRGRESPVKENVASAGLSLSNSGRPRLTGQTSSRKTTKTLSYLKKLW